MSEGVIVSEKWRGLVSGQVAPVRIATDNSTLRGTGTVDDPLSVVGGAADFPIELLGLGPEQDQYDPDANMAAGTVNPLTDPALGNFTVIVVKGADNQATRITGIDATDVKVNTVVLFLNLSISGIDCGQVIFNHLDDSTASANQILCPANMDYMLPIFGGVFTFYGPDLKWHPITENGQHQTVALQNLRFYPNALAPVIAGVVNNWNFTAETSYPAGEGLAGGNLAFETYSYIRVQTDIGGATLTGLAPNAGTNANSYTNGGMKILVNLGPGVLTLSPLDSRSGANHQFKTPNSQAVTIPPNGAAIVVEPLGDPDEDALWQVIALAQDITHGLTLVLTGNPAIEGAGGIALTTQSLLITPAVTPAALPAVPTVTHDWNPGSTDLIIDVATNANGSILGGLIGADDTVAGVGETRILRNVGGGPLILLNEDSGSVQQFVTPSGAPAVIQSLDNAIVQRNSSEKWTVLTSGKTGVLAHPNPITPAVLAATNIQDWNPVGLTGSNQGLSYLFTSWIKAQGQVGSVLQTMLPSYEGHRIVLSNYASGFTIATNHAATGGGGVPFHCPGGTPGTDDFVVLTQASVELIFDADNQFWLVNATRLGGA